MKENLRMICHMEKDLYMMRMEGTNVVGLMGLMRNIYDYLKNHFFLI